jgi:hypothetical protein
MDKDAPQATRCPIRGSSNTLSAQTTAIDASITQLPIEMRIVAVLVRALSKFKHRHDIEPRIELVMQTLHTTEIKSLQASHDLPCGICTRSGFKTSRGEFKLSLDALRS